MATELFNVKEHGVLNKAHEFIGQNKRSMVKNEFLFSISEFPTSCEEYNQLTIDWARIINFMVKVSPKPILKFLVGVSIPKMIFDAKPSSFNWAQYENPELYLDCSPISSWLNGYSASDAEKKTIYLDLIIQDKIHAISFEFQNTLQDVYHQFTGDTPETKSFEYFLRLGDIIQLKFELE